MGIGISSNSEATSLGHHSSIQQSKNEQSCFSKLERLKEWEDSEDSLVVDKNLYPKGPKGHHDKSWFQLLSC